MENLINTQINAFMNEITKLKNDYFKTFSSLTAYEKCKNLNNVVCKLFIQEINKQIANDKIQFAKTILKQTYGTNIDDTCSICLEQLIKLPLYQLPCGHEFHQKCFNNYFESSCPYCRDDYIKSILKEYKKIINYLSAESLI